MYPINPTLMEEIRKAASTEYDDSLINAGAKWFHQTCLPYITGQDARWFKAKRGGGWIRGSMEIETNAGPMRHVLDHCWQFRFGRKTLDTILVSMPYREAMPKHDLTAAAVNHRSNRYPYEVTPMEVTMLPDEWSWWYPGSTVIFTVALAGRVRSPTRGGM